MTDTQRPCGICGNPLENIKHGRKMCRPCSVTPCQVCGKSIKQNSIKRRRVVCGRTCTYERYKTIPNETVGAGCVVCGKIFQVWKSRLATSKYCSSGCREQRFRQTLSDAMKAKRSNPEYRKAQSERTKASWARDEVRHNHAIAASSIEYKQRRSEIAQGMWARPGFREKRGVSEKVRLGIEKMKKREVPPPIRWTMYGATKMRSSWEASFAEFCDSVGIAWVYEPCAFDLSDGSRYTPDFKVSLESCWFFVELHRTGEDAKPGDERKLRKLTLAENEMPTMDGGAPLMVIGQPFVLAIRKFLKARADEAQGG